MQKLSVAIITFNEESRISACIQSILEIADEIVVVDSGSTDHTVNLAKNLGARILIHPFEGYASQKNMALEQCTHPYILSLDADECLDAEALQAVRDEKEKGFPCDGYFLKRITYVGNTPVKHGSWYPDKKIRLLKKNTGAWKGKGVHESLEMSSSNVETLKGHILHYSYKNTSELFEKTRKYADLAGQYLYKNGKKVSWFTVYFKAFFRFCKHYFLKGGILAGKLGWEIGKQQFLEAKWKYGTAYRLRKKG